MNKRSNKIKIITSPRMGPVFDSKTLAQKREETK